MQLIEIEFFHLSKKIGEKDQLEKCIESFPEVENYRWIPMRVFICDKIEDYLKKHIDND